MGRNLFFSLEIEAGIPQIETDHWYAISLANNQGGPMVYFRYHGNSPNVFSPKSA
jgi:hypothetical protein